MSAYSVSSLSPSRSRQVLSAPCSRLVVVFPPLGLGSGSLGTWVDCIAQVPFFRSNANQQNIHFVILSSSSASSCSIAGKLSRRPLGKASVMRLSRTDCPGPTCRQGQLGCPLAAPVAIAGWPDHPSHASAHLHQPGVLPFTPLTFSASTLVAEGCNTSSILWGKVHFCQIWDDPNVVGLTRAAI